jgi:hypothetical protein
MDACNPSPSQGWQQSERAGLNARSRPDAVLALALEHHIAIGRNVPLPMLLDWMVGLSDSGVVEFVPKQDPVIQRMLARPIHEISVFWCVGTCSDEARRMAFGFSPPDDPYLQRA